MSGRVVVVRHATTADTRAGRFSGAEPTPLDAPGRAQAAAVGAALADRAIGAVLTSPVARAVETATLAGWPDAERVEALAEWDYGALCGRVAAEVRAEAPEWSLWCDGAPGGERPTDVVARVDPLIARLDDAVGAGSAAGGGSDVVVVAHGHVLRALIARWLGLDIEHAGGFVVDPASISELAVHHGRRALARLNDGSHLGVDR